MKTSEGPGGEISLALRYGSRSHPYFLLTVSASYQFKFLVETKSILRF